MAIVPVCAFSETLCDKAVELTAVLVEGSPWFRGADVAAALGYNDLGQAVRKHVDDEDKEKLENLRGVETTPLSNPNERAQIFISESGLYSLIMSSKKAEAKVFKRWVTSVVLPTIRRTGSYSAEPPQPLAPSAVEVWEARAARLRAIQLAREVSEQMGLAWPHDGACQNAINEAMLPHDWSQRDMIDAAEFLRRRGHTREEVRRLASEFGRALKAAKERLTGQLSVTNIRNFGPAENGVRMYNAVREAAFLNSVYDAFTSRELFQSVVVRQDPLRAQVAVALEGTRGTRTRARRPT